jgi:guanylate cyclase
MLLQLEYGEEVWQQVREQAGCKFAVFNTHQIYPDHVMTSLAAACAGVTGEGATKDHFMQFFGRCFVRFFSNFGYAYISQEKYTRKVACRQSTRDLREL